MPMKLCRQVLQDDLFDVREKLFPPIDMTLLDADLVRLESHLVDTLSGEDLVDHWCTLFVLTVRTVERKNSLVSHHLRNVDDAVVWVGAELNLKSEFAIPVRVADLEKAPDAHQPDAKAPDCHAQWEVSEKI